MLAGEGGGRGGGGGREERVLDKGIVQGTLGVGYYYEEDTWLEWYQLDKMIRGEVLVDEQVLGCCEFIMFLV